MTWKTHKVSKEYAFGRCSGIAIVGCYKFKSADQCVVAAFALFVLLYWALVYLFPRLRYDRFFSNDEEKLLGDSAQSIFGCADARWRKLVSY
jgi:hypothetical protein